MKSIATATLLLFALCAQSASAQLSGSYTVGGDGPDFATLQQAADSLLAVGVSGPVQMMIRPGVYTEAGGDARVLDLGSEIAGASNLSRIRFEPDRAAGGSKESVILRRSSGVREDGFVVQLRSSHTDLSGVTVELADTTAATAEIPSLVFVAGVSDARVDNIMVDGLERRARRCIYMRDVYEDIHATNNEISWCAEALYVFNYGPGISTDRLLVSGNHLTGMVALATNGPEYGLFVRLDGGGADIVVSDNVLDYTNASGIVGLFVGGSGPKTNLRVVRNQVVGFDTNYFPFEAGPFLEVSNALGGLVANNFISGNASGATGVALWSGPAGDTLTFAHNTVRVGGGACNALRVRRNNQVANYLRVLDNILITEGDCGNHANTLMHFDYTRDAEIDYNVLSTSTTTLAKDAEVGSYLDLTAWQAAGHGEHSTYQRVQFVDDQTDLHLGECAFEDASLHGIPLPYVRADFDSELRDLLSPFVGADEPGAGPPAVFDGPSNFQSGMGPRLMAAADLDGDGDDDLVVTNPDAGGNGDNEVKILWNDGTGSFSAPQSMAFGSSPDPVRIGLINADDELDIVVSDKDHVLVAFGLGGGAFSPPANVSNFATGDLELADYDNDGDTDIVTTQSASTDSGRVVVLINDGDGSFVFTDFKTVSRYIDDVEVADLDADGFLDLLVVDATSTNQLFTLRNLGNVSPGVSKGFDTPVAYQYQVDSVPTASRFLIADFDGDLDLDVVLGSPGRDSMVLIRNRGDGTLDEPEVFEVNREGVSEVAVAMDYEGDGDMDLVVASSTAKVDLMLNDGQGTFEQVVLCASGALAGLPFAIAAGRMDDNASPDIAVLSIASSGTDGSVDILTNLEWTPSLITVEEPTDETPTETPRLYPNYPNPFQRVTTFPFELTETAPVRLEVYDLLGRRVDVLVDEVRLAGDYTVRFDAGALASGIYLYRMAVGTFVETRTMVLVR